jgi:hypothetical protein
MILLLTMLELYHSLVKSMHAKRAKLAGTPPPTNAAIDPNSPLLYAGSLCHK